MDDKRILDILNKNYSLHFTRLEKMREGGNETYSAYSLTERFFLKIIGTAFSDTFSQSVDILLFLQHNGFSVPQIILTTDEKPYFKDGRTCIILYKFMEMAEIDMEQDAEEVGALIGRLHHLMKSYDNHNLIVHDKEFYLDRYISILRKKQYPKVEEFSEYGEAIWNRIKNLPRGYSHGDMYCGNIARGNDGNLYILDFDTSCTGISLYDIALICNQTDYFNYIPDAIDKTAAIYKRLIPEYLKLNPSERHEESDIYDLIGIYHFALQATIIEVYGINCVDEEFFDKQLDWLKRFREETARR